MFRNDRTNPSGIVGGWKGGRDLQRGNPSTLVSDWLNGVSGGLPPTVPQNFRPAPIGEMSTKAKVVVNSPPASPGTSPIIGYKFYKNGVLAHTTVGTGWAERTYIHTGCTTGTTSTYTATAYNAVGEGPHTPSITLANPAAPTITTTGSPTWFGTGTRTYAGVSQDGNGFNTIQFRGSGTWAISANADDSPVTAILVGPGGGAYSGWGAGGGGGAGAMYIAHERTNWDIGTTGDALHTVALGAGQAFNASARGTDSTCTNLHYNGSGWDDITCAGGGGATDYTSNKTGSNGSGGAGANGNAAAGSPFAAGGYTGLAGSSLALTQSGANADKVRGDVVYNMHGGDGGDGGSHGVAGYGGYYAYAGGPGGGGGMTTSGGSDITGYDANGWNTALPSGYNGIDAYGSGSGSVYIYAYSRSGAGGYVFQEQEGFGGIDTNNGSYKFIGGIGYGGSGCGVGAGYFSSPPPYGNGAASAVPGAGGGGSTAWVLAYGSATATYPYGWDASGTFSYSSVFHHGIAYTGNGAGTTMTGTVAGGNGGGGGMYVRLHT